MVDILLLILCGLPVYFLYLLWRFLTLGIKAFKKYLFGNDYMYYPDEFYVEDRE